MRYSALPLSVALLAAWGLAALAGPGQPGEKVAGGSAATVEPTPAVDPATRAKVEELYQKIEALQKEAGVSWAAKGNTGGGTVARVDTAKWQETWKQIDEVKGEIIRLTVGPEAGAKYQEYAQKSSDLQKEQVEVWQDKSLETAGRQARWAELTKQQSALYSEYADIIKKRSAIDTEIWQRQARKRNLDQLKPLLKVTDEEWKALEPRLADVLRLQTALRQAQSAGLGTFLVIGQKWQNPRAGTPEGDLITTAKNDHPEVADVRAKLAALRKAKAAEEAKRTATVANLTKELKVAQDRLRELLTVRQEAVLVVEGLLE